MYKRQDKDTVGLMILTDDGDFCHKIISPKKKVYKTYLAKLDKPLPLDAAQIFEKGITLEDGTKYLPAECNKASQGENFARVKIGEGKFHQEMCIRDSDCTSFGVFNTCYWLSDRGLYFRFFKGKVTVNHFTVN